MSQSMGSQLDMTEQLSVRARAYTDTHTDTHTHRHTQTYTHRHRHTQTHTHKNTYIWDYIYIFFFRFLSTLYVLVTKIEWTRTVNLVKCISVNHVKTRVMEWGGLGASGLWIRDCRWGEASAQLGFDKMEPRAGLRLQNPGTVHIALVTPCSSC